MSHPPFAIPRLFMLACYLVSIGPAVATEDVAAVATARAHAKEALKLAIGKLQETAGPDQRVTARAEILDSNIARPQLTGVWRSWEIKASEPPTPADYGLQAKSAKFVSWLVSSPDANAPNQMNFAENPVLSPVTLMGAGTLGNDSPSSKYVTASKVPVASPAGAYAWAVIDEGVKARINTPFDESAAKIGENTQQLGTGARPGTEFIDGLEGLNRASFELNSPDFANMVEGIGKSGFLPAAEQIAPGSAAAFKALSHDVTLHSMGLFTDTARGGLKQDFHLLTNPNTLPAAYAGSGVYHSRLGISVPSDPRWESLHEFARIYKNTSQLTSLSGAPRLTATTPPGWTAARGGNPASAVSGTALLDPPPGFVLMPTITNVQMVFSLATRDIYNYSHSGDTPKPPTSKAVEETTERMHAPWDRNFAGSSYDYMLHLIYTPIITLHNPYNVALEFSDLKVVFQNVPFALQVFRNGVAQTNGLVPLDSMNQDPGKRFGVSLKPSSSSNSSLIRLLPGAVITFSPLMDPNRNWADEFRSGRVFADFYNDRVLGRREWILAAIFEDEQGEIVFPVVEAPSGFHEVEIELFFAHSAQFGEA